jgi:hypothetical protein
MHTVTSKPFKEADTPYKDVKTGQYFWGFSPEGVPMLKVPGGHVSPVNGRLELDVAPSNYFVGRNVWLCPPRTEITIITGDAPATS